MLLHFHNVHYVIFVGPAEWKSIQVDDTAAQVVHSCVTAVHSLVESLLQGHISMGHLQICLNHKEQFKRLYQQCMNLNMISSFALSRKENVFINNRCIWFPQTR